MTRSGIEHDLKLSPYISELTDENGRSIKFFFSSKLGLTKFENRYIENRENVKKSLINRFKIPFFIGNDLCDINLYRQIECRGFYLEIDGEAITWPNQLAYDGQRAVKMT